MSGAGEPSKEVKKQKTVREINLLNFFTQNFSFHFR
jgi:hypothetical protein